jgi:hypothetical protein
MPARSTNAGSAFDFDVVTDVPPPPSRRPDPAPSAAPASAPPERGGEAGRAGAQSRQA